MVLRFIKGSRFGLPIIGWYSKIRQAKVPLSVDSSLRSTKTFRSGSAFGSLLISVSRKE